MSRRRGRDDRARERGAAPHPGHRPRRAGSARGRPGALPDDDASRTCAPSRPTTTRPSRPTGRPARPPGARRPPTRSSSSSSRAARPARPRACMLTHDNVVASIESFHRIVPPMDHRIVSLLPLSHLLEQAVGLYYALDVGADILYVRSRNPRVIFDALREHRVTSMVVVPQVLDLFWSAIEREVDKRGRRAAFDRLRAIARRLPFGLRRRLFRSIHRPARRPLPAVPVERARSCRRPSSRPGRTSGSPSSRATARPRPGPARARPSTTTGRARSGGAPEGIEMRIDPDDGEIQFRGRTVFARLLERARADRPGVHRGRLVPDRRPRPPRRRTAGSS